MDKVIIVSQRPPLVVTALAEGGRLAEIITDAADQPSIVGNIYAGRVERVLPARFAFVDIGRGRSAFLFLNDKREKNFPAPRAGDAVLVQALRDESGDKGAYVSRALSFGGGLLVLNMTGGAPHCGVSRKITDAADGDRLRGVIAPRLPEGYDAVIRTDAAGRGENELLEELEGLLELSRKPHDEWRYVKPPALVWGQGGSACRGLLELYRDDVSGIVFDDEGLMKEAVEGVSGARSGAPAGLFSLRPEAFEEWDIGRQMERARQRKVWLTSGGFLIIEKTEALYVIDVNTGKFAGRGDHEQSALVLNLEAAAEAARQIRLRNMSGIILIDFIDMKNPENREALTSALKTAASRDRVSVNVLGLTRLGLMEITRKRLRPGLMEEPFGNGGCSS